MTAVEPYDSGNVQGRLHLVDVQYLLPSLARARALSERTVIAADLGRIGQACMIHAHDQPDGQFPPDLTDGQGSPK